jgi:hypothetical protein
MAATLSRWPLRSQDGRSALKMAAPLLAIDGGRLIKSEVLLVRYLCIYGNLEEN